MGGPPEKPPTTVLCGWVVRPPSSADISLARAVDADGEKHLRPVDGSQRNHAGGLEQIGAAPGSRGAERGSGYFPHAATASADGSPFGHPDSIAASVAFNEPGCDRWSRCRQIRDATWATSYHFLPRSMASKNRGAVATCHWQRPAFAVDSDVDTGRLTLHRRVRWINPYGRGRAISHLRKPHVKPERLRMSGRAQAAAGEGSRAARGVSSASHETRHLFQQNFPR